MQQGVIVPSSPWLHKPERQPFILQHARLRHLQSLQMCKKKKKKAEELTSRRLRAGLLWIFTLLLLAWGSCSPSLNHSTEAPGWASTSQLMFAGLPSHVYDVTTPRILGASEGTTSRADMRLARNKQLLEFWNCFSDPCY